MQKLTQQSILETSSITPWSHKIYSNADEFLQDSKGLHHAYIIYRTLRGDYKGIFEPDSVFYVGRSPAAYLKTVTTKEISEADVRQWQRFLWNQAVVPMLIIKSLTQIRVYTAYTKPEKQDSTERIASILDVTANALELYKLLTEIEAGTIYERKPDLFQRSNAVDRFLLDNLNAAAHDMAETQPDGVNKANLKFAHQFLTRLLFVCNLIERGIIKGKHFEDDEVLKRLRPAATGTKGYFLRDLFGNLKTYTQKKEALCRIFSRVKERFNGSLFPTSIKEEKDKYNERFIQILELFLQGDDLPNHQLTLGFWAYDFRVIPIETISAVYESFLGAQGEIEEAQEKKDSQQTSGAYYTPLHLAELTVDMALENIKKPIHELKILDPACGSGVFLVSLFGRMADSFRREQNHTEKKRCIDWARKLIPLLHKLYGVDINPTACHITCFSLYLALLEQLEPMDVEYLHDCGEKLPPLLANTSPESYDTILHGNLFDSELSLKERDFDIVIGNPPWVSRKHQKDKKFLVWQNEKPNVLGPDRQIAHGFMWKAPEYLADSGTACLLLPVSVLLNEHTNQFQKEWLKSVTVDRVVNFSDLRFVLFTGAVHPCVAIRFKLLPSKSEDVIRYEVPKTDVRSQQGGPVYIREEDTTNLRVKDILNAAINGNAPVIWKAHFWGTWRDQRLLRRLSDLPKLSDLAGEITENKEWKKGQGIIVRGSEPKNGWWDKDYLYLDSTKDISFVVVANDCPTVSEAGFPLKAHRPREKKLFVGPKVLISQGSNDMKVAFCAFPVIFNSSLQTITGKEKEKNDDDLLRFLSVVIKSDVAQYFLFHTSSAWGVERDKVLFHEVLSLPFFLPEDAANPQRAKEIVDKVADTLKKFERQIEKQEWFGEEQRRKDRVDEIRRELEPLIREYYDIDKYESMLIEDTIKLAIRSFHPQQNTVDVPTLRIVKPEEAKNYTRTLCEMLNNFGRESNFKVNGEIIQGQPYSVVRVALANKVVRDVPIKTANKELVRIFNRMKTLLQHKQGGFVSCQNLKVFDGDDLYILKPMQMRFWSRTAALNDADEIAGAILDSRGAK